MTTGMNFWDTQVWSFIITMTLLFGAMILANIMRNVIPLIRKLMIPSSVLGGFLLLFVDFILDRLAGVKLLNNITLEMLTYHGLGLGFVAMALRQIDIKQDKKSKTGSFDTGVTVVAGYLIQAVFGLAITIGLYYVLKSFWASGLLLPMGYGQGPGQAFNWGHNYEFTYGFSNGTSFGLTVAAMGFVSASIGGIIYLNVLRRKGIIKGSFGKDIEDDNLTAERITGGDEIPLSESMDKFTVQLALVFLAYVAAYLFMMGIDAVVNTGVMGSFGFNTVRPLVWGFNFLIGTIFALILRAVLRGLKKKGVIKREYTNDFMQNRIAGFMFDVMVVASIAAIRLLAFTHHEFIIPLVLICVVGAVITYIYLLIVCKRVFPLYEHEAFLSLYGMLTGTASTGVILLREKDPKFETQASNNLVYQQPWAILFGFPMLLLLGYAPQSVGKAVITLAVCAVLFVIMNLIIFRRSIFKKKK
jgi:ESS family glutamate:Na+ symporter